METLNNLPIYNVTIEDKEDGMYCISLVDDPAVEKQYMLFNNNKQSQLFQIQNADEQIIMGVVMRADYPIYRCDNQLGEYYVTYSKNTIKQMAEKYLQDDKQHYFSFNHNGKPLSNIYLQQLFIKDIEKGINPNGFEDIEDGSLFATLKVEDNELWDEIKHGNYQGFSLEGYFSYNINKDDNKETELLEDIVNLLKQIDNK